MIISLNSFLSQYINAFVQSKRHKSPDYNTHIYQLSRFDNLSLEIFLMD
jgi:hypothetical protein